MIINAKDSAHHGRVFEDEIVSAKDNGSPVDGSSSNGKSDGYGEDIYTQKVDQRMVCYEGQKESDDDDVEISMRNMDDVMISGKKDENPSGEEPCSQECEDTSQGTVTARALSDGLTSEELDNQIPSSNEPEGGADGVLDGPTTITCEGKERTVKKKHEPWACATAIGTGEIKQDSVKKRREPCAPQYWCRFIVHVPVMIIQAVCATVGATGGIKHNSVKKKRTCTAPCALRWNLLIAFAVLGMCTTSVGATGVVCENDPRNESVVKCQYTSMNGGLHDWSVPGCDSLNFSPSQTEPQQCHNNYVTVDGYGTVDGSSFVSTLVIVIRDPGFSGTVGCSVVQNDTQTSAGTFTISAPIVNCTSVEYSGGMLTVALDYGSQTLPPNQLTVLFSPINSNEAVLNKTMDANNLTVALAHGDLVPGSYTICIKANNYVGSALAHCEKPIDIAEERNNASSQNPEELVTVLVASFIIIWVFY